jgi:hypothetical protein
MADIFDISDHIAKVCTDCGSAKWCLIKSGKIECSECGSIIENAQWGITIKVTEKHFPIMSDIITYWHKANERRKP